MSEINIKVEKGVTTISGPVHLISRIQSEVRAVLNMEQSTALNELHFNTVDASGTITHEIREKIALIYPGYKPELTDEQLLAVEALHLDKLKESLSHPTPALPSFTLNEIEIPKAAAALLIEAYSINQPNSLKYLADKFEEPNVYTLNIPICIPILFKEVNIASNVVSVSFAEIPGIPIEVSVKLFNAAIESLQAQKVICANFKGVDLEGFEHDIQTALEKIGDLFIVKTDDSISEKPHTSRSFSIYAIAAKPYLHNFNDQIYLQKSIDLIEKKYFAVSLRKCIECDQIFSDSQHDDCITYHHEGDQIPFEDGKTEHIEKDQYGQDLVWVNYECCGNILKDEPGCLEVNHGKHQAPHNSDLSKFEIQVLDGVRL